MYFHKLETLKGKDVMYNFRYKNPDVTISGIKYEPDPKFSGLSVYKTEDFAPGDTKGHREYFWTLVDKTIQGYKIPAGTVIIRHTVQRITKKPLVEMRINMPYPLVLDYDSWRSLRFHMDEAFLLSGRIPE